MTRQAVSTSAAPPAAGPYSQAIAAGDFVFCAGQIGFDPATGSSSTGHRGPGGTGAAQPEAVLDAAGCTFADVVKTTCFLADIADFAAFNAVYARFLADPPPARSTFQVAALPKGARVEIEAIAVRDRA